MTASTSRKHINRDKIAPALKKESRESFRLKLVKASSILGLARELGVGEKAIRRAAARLDLQEDLAVLAKKSKHSPSGKRSYEVKKVRKIVQNTQSEFSELKKASPPKPIRRVDASSVLEEEKPASSESTNSLEQDFYQNLSARMDRIDSQISAGISPPQQEAQIPNKLAADANLDQVFLESASALAIAVKVLAKRYNSK